MALVDGVNQSLDDILGDLDATSDRGRQQGMIRGQPGPRIPYMHDLAEAEWRPLPKLEDVRHNLGSGHSRKFVNTTRHSGLPFSEPTYLKPKMLDIWTAERHQFSNVCMERHPGARGFSNHAAPPRFHAQSEPLPEPTDDLLDKSHKDWMPGHYAERAAKLYPVSHALGKVEKAKKVADHHKEMREKTIDILTRKDVKGAPQMGEKAKRGLGKVLGMVKTTRAFNKLMDLDALRDEEERDKERLLKAKSAPVLQFTQPPPEGRLKHLRHFQHTEHNTMGSFRQTTPWQHVDEIQDLKDLGRFRKTW